MNAGKQIKGQQLYSQQQNKIQANTHINGPIILCDGLQTPDNFGSILRIADAAGSKKIILLENNLNLNNKKLSKLARSTEQHLIIEQCNLKQIRHNRALFKSLYALEITDQSEDIYATSIINCNAIIIGHESTGIREEALALCDKAIHIPMYGTNGSMNISHALAIFLYEWRRQQANSAPNPD